MTSDLPREGSSEGIGKALGVFPDLTLVDHTLIGFVDKFNRVRQNMLRPRHVNVVDHGSQSC